MSIHSDAEMQIASLMAYLDIPAGTSLGRYMDTHPDDSNVQRIREIAQSCTGDSHGYDNWRVVGVGDDQNASGMYGCMIDDGRGDAIIAFRGSESDQILEDWGGADFGLMNNTETWQQAQAEEFTRRMYEEFGNQYDNYVFTGHSLGGNLAIDAAIDAPEGMRDRISQVVGLDSPGFSDEYWVTHADRIREMEGRISHYQWSGVGAIFETPGTERTVNVRDMGNCLSRHDLRNLDTGTGSVSDRPGGMTADELAIKAAAGALEYTGPFNPFGPGIIISGITGLIDIWNRVTSIGQHMRVTTAASTEAKARFEINTTSILTLEGRYEAVEANLRQAESALSDIETRLKYHSSVGWIIKYKIRSEAVRVNSLAETMKRYREVLRNAVTNYQQADMAAAAAYGISGTSGGTSSTNGGTSSSGNSGGTGTSTTGGNGNGAPRYPLPDYVTRDVGPYENGIYGPYIYHRDGTLGRVKEWNDEGMTQLSCTYYTLRKLNERGISFPCIGGPGHGGAWMNYFDTESGLPYSMAGDNSLNELFGNNSLPQDNIVVSCSGNTEWGHVFLIDHVYTDENGQVWCEFSDNTPNISSLNGSNPVQRITLEELNNRYNIRGAAILGATDASY